jgi:ribonucleoside-diphosphate reductase alpha chain
MNDLPDLLHGSTNKVPFGCGHLYLTVNEHEGKPVQAFLRVGKTGTCQHALLEGIGRLVSTSLDHGVPLEVVHKAISAIRCDQGIAGVGRLSCLDALARALQAYLVKTPEE